jgi:hypothetical protein
MFNFSTIWRSVVSFVTAISFPKKGHPVANEQEGGLTPQLVESFRRRGRNLASPRFLSVAIRGLVPTLTELSRLPLFRLRE